MYKYDKSRLAITIAALVAALAGAALLARGLMHLHCTRTTKRGQA